MRELPGNIAYDTENQSLIELMYKSWVLVFSFAIMLPMRWLAFAWPEQSKVPIPVIPTALLLVACGELVLNNPTISPPGTHCRGDVVTISFTGTNLPEGENIQIFMDDISTYNPFSGGGTNIGSIPIDYSCSTCPSILGIMSDPCHGGTQENDNEYLVMSSGCGFNVNDLVLDYDINNNILGIQNNDVGGSSNCQFVTPDATLISTLQAQTNCSNLIVPAGPGTSVPAGVIVLVFSDTGTPSSFTDFSSLCQKGLEIYVMQSGCERTAGAFTDNPASGTRITTITAGACTDQVTWGNSSPYPIVPGEENTESLFRFHDGSYLNPCCISNDPNYPCNYIPSSSIDPPNISNSLTSFSYTIPNNICGSSTGLTNFYISGMVDLPAPCMDVLYTPPSALSMTVMCVPVIDPVAPLCADDAPIILTVTPPGGTWSGPGITDSSLGTFDPGAANIGNNQIIFVSSTCGASDTITIVVNCCMTIDPLSLFPVQTNCNGGDDGNILFDPDGCMCGGIMGGVPPYTYDWDLIGTPQNDVFSDDGLILIDSIPAGTYAIIVTDANGCSASATTVVENAPPFNVNTVITNENCNGGTNGAINITSWTGPTGIVIYNWDYAGTGFDDDYLPPVGATNDPQDLLTGLAAGTYYLTITVTDDLSFPSYTCIYMDTFVITEPTPVVVTAPDATISCFGGTANLFATGSGGTPPYVTYDWSNIPGTNNGQSNNGVVAGTYTITVTDSKNCKGTDIVVVTQPASALTASAVGQTIPCNNGTGMIDLTVSGGTPPYTYLWSNSSTNQDPTGLFAGTYTVTVTDANGCTTTASATITVVDNIPPVISGLPGPTTIECPAVPSFTTPTATDACGAPTLTFTNVTINGGCPAEYTVIRTWTATDVNGNTTTATQSITVDDTTPPVISGLPGPTTIQCSGTPSWTTPTVTDCSTFTLTFADVTTPGSCPNAYSITRTWTATDACGNISTASQTINVVDTTPPVISALPGPSTIQCSGTPSWTTPTATDNCSTPTLTFADVTTPGSCPNTYSITRTWTATDACGNVTNASQTINIQDTTPPVISALPGTSTIQCSGTPSWTTPTATDNCSTPTLTFADVTTAGSCPNNYSITRTWTATDACGNVTNASQTINIQDTTPPVISALPGPSTIECSGTPTWTTPTATDNCSTPTLTSTTVTTPGSCPNQYTLTRTWTATDACGNVTNASQTINVVDTQFPVISALPGPTTIQCTGTPTWTTPTATDNCGTPTLTFGDVTTPGSCPNNYSITRTWTATDACGHVTTASQTFNVVDTTPPVISALPGPTTIQCSGTPTWTTPTATDNCGTPILTFADVTTPGPCPNNYSITRTWTATDACGNVTNASQTINVVDTTPPVISALPGTSTIQCSGTPSWTTPTATDNCSTPTLTFADVTTPGSCPNAYSITRTWTATDACGNVTNASQTINVVDTTPPVISALPGTSTVQCSGTPSWTTPTATDNCSTPTLTFADVTTSGSCPSSYSITRTWTATDACGNVTNASQTFNVVDTTPPVISALPGTSTIQCSGTPSWTTPTATDNCSTPTLTFTDVTTPGSCPNNYSITRTWTATDACGNVTNASQTFNVVDTTPPVISALPGPAAIECSGTPTWVTPTATDNCSTPTLTSTLVTTPGSCPNEYTITRNWTATDACGNVANASQTFNVDDTTPPVISALPGPSTIQCTGTPTWTTPTATDNCGTPSLTFADVTTPGSCPNAYSITRTWTANDGCGNIATASQTFNIVDTTPPVISALPGPSTIQCTVTPTWTTPTATDNCGTPTLTFADVTTPGSCPNAYSITRTWTATDACGNVTNASQTINVVDTTPPVISALPGPSTIQCSGTPSWTTPTATDNCSTPTLTFADVTTPGSCTGSYSITRTWTATDACGNVSNASQTINVDDTVPPVISALPAPITIECSGIPSWTTPTATDNCGTPTLTFADVNTPGTCPGSYSITRTWTATDACGNVTNASQTITIDDTMPPVISALPGTSTIECSGTPSWTTPTATDNCGTPTLTFADVTTPGSCPNEYSITRTWTATDACGNVTNASQTINVDDTTPPVISALPGPASIECSGTPTWVTPTATDNCGTPTLTFADVTTPGSCPNEYSITRTWTATDACGNVANASQTFNVDDTTPPVISALPGPSTIQCTGTPTWTTPTATDNCGTPTLTFADVTTPGSCPNNYSITRTWTATDACGNVANASQTFNIVDTTPPVITALPGPSTIECSGTPSFTTPTATDNCGAPTLTFADVTTPGSCPNEYSTTRTWTATDACGNVTNASQTINVDDTTPPVISALPGPSTIQCSGTPSWTTPTATDNCSTPTLTFADVTTPGSCAGSYSITRTWTATDACGNVTNASQTINVDDTLPPVISALPAPITIECSGTPAWTTPTATDNCGTPTLTFADVNTPGTCPGSYSITRTWTATDACGNVTNASQTITIDDTVPPVISALPGPSTIECSGTPSWTTPTATDNCGTPTLTFADVTTPGSCPNEYSVTRTWTATDACGNVTNATQTINIDDTTPPVISALPGPASIECSGTPTWVTPTATDNCGTPTLTFADVTTPGSCPNEYSITRTWTATDACGNVANASQTFNVDDTTPPVISALPGPSTIQCTGTPTWTTPTATDNCGTPTLTFADVTTPGSCPNNYSITRTWTATDACGNMSNASQTFNIEDTTPPVISTLPGPSTIECSGTPSFTTPTATDNCGIPTLTFADVTAPGSCPNNYSVTRTWTATDACGNVTNTSQTINVDDTTPPVISPLPGPSTIQCSGTPSWTTPTATDNCSTPTLTFADVTTPGSCAGSYSITRTWTATDACGNVTNASQTINVDDTVPPVISALPAPITIECSGTPSWTTPTATDNCGTPTLTFTDLTTPGSCPNEYSITRTWTATDACGNVTNASQTINVDDTTPPVISSLPGPASIECSGTPTWVTPTATDNCGTPTLTFADVTTPGSCPNEYSITRTWTATDACGNVANASQTFNVDDTTPPVISALPGPSTIQCSGTPTWTTPTATDNCGTPTLTFADVTTPGSCPNNYSITRTWTATDACGNVTNASQTFNIIDTTPPVISALPGPSTIECSGTPTWTTPTATDNCGTPTLTFADVTTPGSCPNEYSITRTWTATDACGNVANASQTINVDDTTPPVISALPPPSTIQCSGTPSWTTPTATDNCTTPTLTFADVNTPGSCPGSYNITRTWTATDACGNVTNASQTINVDDTVPPVISALPAPITIECSGTPSWTTPTATDNCGTPTLTFADVNTPGSCPGSYSITRTWTATDACGNVSNASQTITVDDTTPPVISALPGPSTVECSGTPTWVTPTATDNCGTPTLTFADVTTPGSCPNEYTITRTWTATDACGNVANASQVFNVDDTTPPVISALPGPSTMECTGTPSWTTPTATDNCGTPTLTFADVTTPGSCPNAYSITRTWTANDGCGNIATASQTINIVDTTPPVISALPGPASIECSGTPTWVTPTATDNCGTPTLTFADVTTPGSCPNEYSITRTWTATDACGNVANASQTFNVDDTTPPVISALPAPTTIECTGTPSWTTPTATDNCGIPTLTFADVTTPGSCPNEYSITRTWTATDACGNVANASQTINVDDTTPPVISALPGPSTIQCTGTPTWTTPTATDNCGIPTLTFADVTTPGSCPNNYSITRTWTATDACGNVTNASQTYNIVDTTPPVISALPAPTTIECTGTPSWTTPTATDNCGTPTLTFADVTTPGSCPNEYSITRTWTATDACGNVANASQTINVDDTTPPVISPLPGPTTIECSGTPSWTTPTATDNCGTPTLTFADVTTPGSCPGSYSITRTWTATDACGNIANASQTINVDDTTPPVISPLPGPTTIECSGTPSWTTPTATDNCGTPTLTFADVTTPGSCPGSYSITRTWTATDACGNVTNASQTINVDDTIPPVISSLPAPTTIECSGTPSWTTPTATDNCGTPTLTFADVTTPGSCPNEYSITRTWTATDACGNVTNASQTINVDDTTPPVISALPGPSTIECSGTPSWTTPTATDNCSTPTLTFADVTTPGSCPNEYSITRTWTATDACGNVANASQTINVDDTTPPVISALPAPTTIECTGTPSWTTPTATDNCGIPTLTFADVTTPGSCPNEYSITRTWTATDACGNTVNASQTINVDDTTPPVISALPGPSTIECSGSPSWTTPTATDNCGTPTLTFTDVTTPGSCPNEYSITRTWTATDACGNVTNASQTINVDDTTPPVISALPAPTTIECSGTPSWTTPTATDNCGTPTLTFADVTTPGSCPNEYSITRTWTATDACGNVTNASQTINVDDTTLPVISPLPGPTTIECSGTPSWTTPTATDNCSTPTLTFADVTTPGSCPGSYSITRTWTATDACGNTTNASQTINVDDTVPPVISALPAPTTIECSGTPSWTTPTATDNCGTPTLTFADITTPGSCPNEYSITRTWTATDACGNVTNASQTINVDDTTPPVISALPGPSTIECSGTPSWTTPTATDNCSTPTLTFADVTTPGSCPNEYSITRTWTATDACGNVTNASQTINVDDTTSPVLSALPAPTTIECTGTPSWTTPTATDNCGTPTLTFADVTTPGSCPNEYSITRTWTATDACGNTANASQTINVDDTTPPVISALPGPSTIECSGTPSWTTPTATDNCGTPTLTFADVTTPGSCPNEYSITRTWTATDACGNVTNASQTINVDDTTPPTISALPAPTTIECSGTPSWTTPTATDNCGTPTLTFADVTTPGSCPNEYSITRTWTATDACGNITNASQTINVDDATPPVISPLPGPTTIECSGTPSWTTPTATDNCSTPTLTFADVTTPGSCPGSYSITRTWTATDACGNVTNASQTITVDDTVPPVISALPAPTTIECTGTPSWTTPTATDNCGTPTLTFADVTTPGSCPNEYSITRTWTATDACGNVTNASQTINIDDTTPPVISALPGPSTIECSGTPSWTTPTATDNCSTPTLTFADVTTPGSCPNEYSVTRTWTATDACGNVANASQTINVDDTTPPVISALPAPTSIECTGTPSWTTPTATDNCGTPTLTFADVTTPGSCPNEYSITRTWTATDACGNTANASQTFNVDDTTPPVISALPGPSTIECTGSPSWTTPTATDNCGTPTLTFADVTTPGSCPNEYSITRTWTATDACGNVTNASQTINVEDTTPPAMTAPADLTVDCLGDVPPLSTLTYTDNCGPGGTVTGTQTGPSGNPLTIVYTWTVTDNCGNTTTESQTITILEILIPLSVSADFCEGGSVDVYGVTYDMPGVYQDTIPSMTGGCDTLVTITIIENPATITNLVDEFCDGSSYILPDGSSTMVGGSFGPYTLTTSSGCDSIVNVDLTLLNTTSGNETYTGCQGDNYFAVVNGSTYNESNPSGTEQLIGSNGCDSIVTINLTFLPPSTGFETYTGCEGDGYFVIVNGTTYNEGNPTGTELLVGSNGCDSTVTVSLTFGTVSTGNENYVGCSGDGYEVIVNGTAYNESNPTGTEILTGINGCDSSVTINLFFNPALSGVETYSGCEGDGYSVVVNGTTYNENNPAGTEILTSTSGCDSTVTISLTFSQTSTGSEIYSGCEGDGYSVVVNGTIYNESNPTGVEIVNNSFGCDSTVTITLSFAPSGSGSETYQGCQGDGYSVTVNGTIYNEGNPSGTETFPGSSGCDSTVTIDLHFAAPGFGNVSYSGCVGDGYSVTVNGTIYNESNPTGTEILLGSNGCDSTVTINLFFSPALSGVETYSGCEGDGYSVVVNGTTYNENNPTGTEILTSTSGCDSTVTITLSFSSTSTGSESYSGCQGDGYSVVVNGTIYNEGNPTGTEILNNSFGCDSTVTINLSFAPSGTGTETYQGCQGDGYTVTVNGTIYNEGNPSGTETFPGSGGCDSTVTIDLHFAAPGFGFETYNGCTGDLYDVTVNGTIYNEGHPSGIEMFTGPNGCDTTVTINLVFNNNLTGTETYTGCEGDGYSVIVNGTVYNESNPTGTETFILPGCDSVVTIDLFFAPLEIVTIDPLGPICTSSGIATLTATPTGGVWSGAVNSDQLDPGVLGVGTHEIIYTVNPGACESADTIEVVIYELMFSCQTIADESAPGASDGEGQVTVSGGVPDYEIQWVGPVSGSIILSADGNFAITSLPAGIYNVYVEDQSGCSAFCQFIINVNIPCDLVIDNVAVTDATCPGVNNGGFQVNASGGQVPYQYSIDGINFQSQNTFSALAPGNYTVFVRDNTGCIVTQDVHIGVGLGPELSIVEIVDATCGVANGSIEVTATGGSTPYMYSLNGAPYGFSGLFPGLIAGVYNIYLEDNAGCRDTIAATVLASNAPVINNVNIVNANCGQADGSITIIASGGVPPLMYSINGGSTFQTSNVFSGLAGGPYSIVVQDATGCQTPIQVVNVPENGAPTIDDVVATQSSCDVHDAQITITATGIPTLTYSINGINYFTSNVFTGLGPGNYTVYVKDGNGCTSTDQISVTTVNGPQITDIDVVNTSCGEINGSILITVTGGTGILEFFLNGDSYDDENFIEDLPDGTYDIVVIDENGCSAVDQVTINPSEGPGVDVYFTWAHCSRNDGIIELDGFDGMPPYTYSINGGSFGVNFTFTGLFSDFHTVAVKDSKGCIFEKDVFLPEWPVPEIDDINTTDPGCGLTNGTIEVIASGGDPPLMYSILPNIYQAGNIFNPVAPGTYTVTVKDEAGCTATSTVVINSNPAPVINNVLIVDTQCGQSTGSITVQASGGVAPLMYSLNNGPFGTSNVFTSLSSGIYTVHVKGTNQCEVSQVVTITSVGAQTSSFSASFCIGSIYQIAGNSYSTAGNYSITIPNGASNGCDSIINLTLSADPLEQKTLSVSICIGSFYTINGLDYSIAGHYLIDTILASLGCDTIRSLDLSINQLDTSYLDVTICTAGVYTINGNDYTVAGEYVVDTLPAVIGCDSIQILRLQVADFNSLEIDASICDGEGYTINGVDYTVTGLYVIDTVAGPNGCDTIRTLNLAVNPLPQADAGSDQILDCANQSVVLNGSGTGGTPLWTGPDINAGNANQLTPTVSLAGQYILTIISPEGCTDMDTVDVTLDPSNVVADAGEDDFFSCDIDTVILHAGPLGADLIYQWSGPGINATNDNQVNPIILVPGTYTLVVTDTVTECVSVADTVIITDITTNIIAIIQDPSSLTCFSTFVDLNATGSSSGPNIAYIWFDEVGNIVGSSPFLEVTSGGMFMFVVKDTISGCFDNDSVFVEDLQEYPPVDAGNPQTLDCNNETVTLNEGATNNLPNIIFNWTGPVGGILTPADLLSVDVGTGGLYFLTGTDTVTGCSNYDSVMVADMTQLPFAEIQLVEYFTCIDSTAMIDIGNSDVGANIHYEWNGPQTNGVASTSLETTFPGTYYLTVANAATGCEASDTILLELPEIPQGVQVDISIPLCEGDPSGGLLVTDVTGGTPEYMYSLNGVPLQLSPIFENLIAGTYSLVVVDANGCSYEQAVTIPEGQHLTIDIGPDIEIELGDSIQLSATVNLPWSQIDSIVWALGDHLSCTHCIDPTLYGLLDEIISATVYAGSCLDSDMLSVRVDIDADVYIPNVFTPNGDGQNDEITIWTDDRVRRIVYLEIFDRWGDQVFVATDFPPNAPGFGWDGTFRGQPMNPAVFAYVAKVELINGLQIPYKGDITLLR